MLLKRIRELKVWKEKPFIISSAVAIVLLLFFMVRIIIPCKEYRFEGGYSFETGVAVTNTVVYEGIMLSPGIYLIDLEYETDKDLGATCTVVDGTVFTGGLLTNYEPFYSALEKTDYAVWLYEKTENLQVVVTYDGEGTLITGNLTVKETNQLWTMLMTIVIFVWLLMCGLVVFCCYDRRYPISRKKKHTFFCLAVISLIASVPYLCGYTITGADLTYHLQRIEGVKDGLLGGFFPVRLEPRWLYDHGYADAIFYCNTFLYFPAVLRMLGFPIYASYNAYCVVLNIATVWISYYCFGKMFRSRNIGIVCSALYTLSIFRTYKLIITTATGEGSAFAFLPLVLYGLYRVFTENPEDRRYKTAWVPIMLGVSGLIQTHVLTCEITAFVIIVYCLSYIRKVFRRNTFLELTKGALIAVLISLWYLVPFLDYYITQDVHIKHVSARTIQSSGLYLAQLAFHFWTTGSSLPSSGNGMQNSHPIGIGLVLLVSLGLFLILWFSGVFRDQKDHQTVFMKITALIGTLLLVMSTSYFPWDHIQSLHSITATLVSSLQFPNRFLGWGTTCLVAVFGYCLSYFTKRDRKLFLGMTAVAVIGVVTSGMYLLDFVNRDQDYYILYNEESMGFGYVSGSEYVIQGTDPEQLKFSAPLPGDGVEILNYEKKSLGAELDIVNQKSSDSFVELPLLLYKGYRAMDRERGTQLQIFAGDNGKLRVLFPANYSGSVQILFVSPFYWRVAEWLSLATAVLLVAAGWRYRRKEEC